MENFYQLILFLGNILKSVLNKNTFSIVAVCIYQYRKFLLVLSSLSFWDLQCKYTGSYFESSTELSINCFYREVVPITTVHSVWIIQSDRDTVTGPQLHTVYFSAASHHIFVSPLNLLTYFQTRMHLGSGKKTKQRSTQKCMENLHVSIPIKSLLSVNTQRCQNPSLFLEGDLLLASGHLQNMCHTHKLIHFHGVCVCVCI